MSVIPTVYNQGTGLIGSTTGGAAIPSNIDDLIINNTLLVGGEATFNGVVTVNNTLTVTGAITFQDVTVQGTFILEGKTPTQLAFYTTGGELTGTADMTYSNGVTTLTNVTVTNNVTVDGTMTANVVSADELRIQPIDVTSQDNFLPLPMIDTTNQNQIVVDGDENNNLAYNPNRNTFRTNKAQFTNDVTMDATLSVEDDVTLVNGDLTISNGDLSIGSLPEGNFSGVDFEMAFFNPNNGKFFKRTGYTLRGNTAVLTLDEVEISDTLTVTNDTTLARTFVTPTSRNNDEDYRIAIIDKDNGQICREQNDSDFFYNTQDNKLTVKNLDVTDTANVTGLTITPLTRSDDTDYPMLFYDTSTNDICIDTETTSFTINPFSNTLTLAGRLVLTTGRIFNHSTNVYMGFKAISNNGTDLSGFGYNIGLWQDGHIRFVGRNNIRFNIYNGNTGTTTEHVTINDGGIISNTTIRNGTLPLNYVQTYTSRDDGTTPACFANDVLGWGNNAAIAWRTQASQGATPKIHQYGANINDNTVTPTLRGAIDFQNDNDKFFLTNNAYAGWWYVDIHLLWQNLKGVRLMPRIDLGKQLTPTSTVILEPQVGQGSEYLRNDIGELSSLSISGPIYMESTDNRFSIRTLLVDPSTQSNPDISVPPNWNDQSTEFRGLGLTISCKYLGLANTAGETVNAL